MDSSISSNNNKNNVTFKNQNALAVIKENEQPRKMFNKSQIKQFKQQIADPEFFKNLKKEV